LRSTSQAATRTTHDEAGAAVVCRQGKRRWLIYAHSPLENRDDVTITVPEFGKITIDVPREGAFYLVDEADRSVRRVR
jgi:proline racemase